MFLVSRSAIEQVSRDIQDGVTYPEFWDHRYEEMNGEETQQKAENEQPGRISEPVKQLDGRSL